MSKKVLVVDDSQEISSLIEAWLVDNGYQVSKSSNGEEGWEQVDSGKPDLIILDVLMPVKDGFTFFKELKAKEETKNIPVLILTVRAKMEDTFRVMGADDFIAKPCEPKELLEKVRVSMKTIVHDNALKEAAVDEESKTEEAPKEEEPPKEESPKEEPPKEEPPKEEAAPAPEEKSEPQKPKQDAGKAGGKLTMVLFAGPEAISKNIKKKLYQMGYQVEFFSKKADMVTNAVDYNPGLIMVDVLIDGQCPNKEIASLRKLREFKKLPIIVFSYFDKENLGDVSANQRKMDIQNAHTVCLNDGANEYIGEFSEETFLAALKKYLTK